MAVSKILTRIHYLEDILLLGAVCHPAVFSYVIRDALFPQASREKADAEVLVSISASMGVIVLIAAIIAPQYLLFLNYSSPLLYPIYVIIGPLCIFFEYFINSFYFFLRKGIFPRKLNIHSYWAESNTPLSLALIFIITAEEELIFRQMMFSILMGVFDFSFLQTLLITSFFYSANHIFMGFRTTGTKFFTGIIYGSLYYISGLSILVPLIVHYSQNITLLSFPRIVNKC